MVFRLLWFLVPCLSKWRTPNKCGCDFSSVTALLEFDLDEGELIVIGIDDVVLHACFAEVGFARHQVGEGFAAVGGNEPEPAGGERHHDVIVLMAVKARLRARRKS